MFRHHRVLRTSVTTGLLAGVLLVAACAGNNAAISDDANPFTVAKWRQVPAKPKAHAETFVVEHDVEFPAAGAALSADQQADLATFLDRQRQPGTSVVRLYAAPDVAAESLSAQRLKAVARVIQKLGWKPQIAAREQASAGAGNRVRVAVSRTVALAPDCTSKPARPNQRPDYRLGCSDEANLANMVADPRDLERGRDLEPGDGEALALGNERYRTGKVTPVTGVSTEE